MEARRLIEATCPECRGPLSEVVENGVLEYRCLVKHRYSPIGLLDAHSEAQERVLWMAALVLEEAATIAREISVHLPGSSRELVAQGEEKRRQAGAIRAVLQELKPFMIA